MNGSIESYAIHRDGTRELIECGNNLVVNSAYVAMAYAMKGEGGGFLYWALGDGNTSVSATWDAGVTAGTIVPLVTNSALARETFRKEIDPEDIVFLDSSGEVSETPTNRLRISIVFDEDEPGGASNFLREWGIFGGTATDTPGSGQMVNRKVHASYEKTDAVAIERVLTFTF